MDLRASLDRLIAAAFAVPGMMFLAVVLVAMVMAELRWPLYREREEPPARIPVNIAFAVMNGAVATLLPVSTVLPARWAAAHGVGLLHQVALPFAVVAVVTVLARSLSTYAVHRLSHAAPLLWRVHRVHHADAGVDLSTGLRNHPAELAIVAPMLAGVTVLLGLDAGVLLIYEAVALPFALWSHANLRLPPGLDRRLRWLLVTPAMHHVHHSAVRAEADSNYGDVFSGWDRLFGTYRVLDHDALDAARFGLQGEDAPAHLARQLLSPLRRQPRRVAATDSLPQ